MRHVEPAALAGTPSMFDHAHAAEHTAATELVGTMHTSTSGSLPSVDDYTTASHDRAKRRLLFLLLDVRKPQRRDETQLGAADDAIRGSVFLVSVLHDPFALFVRHIVPFVQRLEEFLGHTNRIGRISARSSTWGSDISKWLRETTAP